MKNINKFIEHTNLKPDLTASDIEKLAQEAIDYKLMGICVPPFWLKKIARDVHSSGIQLVSVIGFPMGYQMTETKIREIDMAIESGANELDVVMNISAFKSGMSWVKSELVKCSKVIHGNSCLMKVIIETAYLSNDEIVLASKLCQDAGADFVKTSTGFAPSGALVDHVRLIRDSLHSNVGVKASGGIRDLATAVQMIEAGADRLGVSASVQIVKEALNQTNG